MTRRGHESWLVVRRPKKRWRPWFCALLGHSYPVEATSPAGHVVVCVRCRGVMK